MVKLKINATNTGNGVFAFQDIPRGSLIVEMQGRIMSGEADEKAIDAKKIRPDDPFQIGEEEFIKLNKLPYTFNHSCEPNSIIVNGTKLMALRNIKKGEEICYDYSAVVCTHCQWSMKCRCGSSICRKKVGTVESLPKSTLEKYLKLKAIPNFIRREVLP